MAKNDRIVFKNDAGQWANKRHGAERAGSLHDTQAQAIAAAKANLLKSGGGELEVKGVDGRIRSKDTIGKSDPVPPRDKEH